MDKYILLILIFFLPFVVYKFGISAYETPKVLIAECLIGLLVFLKVLQIKKDSFRKETAFGLILLGLLFLLSLVQIIGSPASSFFGNVFRLQGVFLLWCLMLFSVASGNITLKSSFKWVYVLAFVFLFCSIYLFRFNMSDRAVGVLGEPNALAATALIFFTFIYRFNKKNISFPALGLMLFILFLTRSRSVGIALGVESVFLLTQYLKFSLSKSVAICLAVVILSLSTPFLGSISALGSTVGPVAHGFEDRGDIWWSALHAGLKSPIWGTGFGNIQTNLKEASVELNLNTQYAVVDSSHNFLLDYWVGGGVIGLALILGLILISIKNLIYEKQRFELTLLLGVITIMLFNPVSIVVLLTFWWLIGRGIFIKSG